MKSVMNGRMTQIDMNDELMANVEEEDLKEPTGPLPSSINGKKETLAITLSID